MVAETEVLERLKSLEDRVKKLESSLFSDSAIPRSPGKTKKLSAKEFLMSKIADTDTKRALVLAYFLEHTEGTQSFNTHDLDVIFRAAKEQPPKNINSTVDKNVAQGFMMETAEKKDSKKAWCLTATGEKHVETKLNKQGE